MSEAKANPFERFGLDPAEGIAGITERMREHIRAATSEADKAEIRDAWVALTKDPRRRLALSLGAHPETRAPLGSPPPPPEVEAIDFEPSDILPFVSLSACFVVSPSSAQSSGPWQEDLIFAPKRHPATKKKE